MATTRRRSTKSKTSKPKASKEDLLHYYREMLMIRRFEEKAGQLYGMGLIGGFCHLYIGQEAVVIGMQAAHRAEVGVDAQHLRRLCHDRRNLQACELCQAAHALSFA